MALPGWLATMEQVNTPVIAMVLPATPQPAKLTGSPELAVADTVIGAVPYTTFAIGANVIVCGVLPTSVPGNTVTLLLLALAVMRSRIPSPFTSATVTENGSDPTASGLSLNCVNPPAPFPISTVTL